MSTTELILVAAVLFLLFGSKKLPEFARGIGESARELKKANKEFKTAMSDESNDEE